MGPHVTGMTIAQTISLVRDAFAGEAFTAGEASARGIGPDRLERAAGVGALRRLKRGVYSLPDAKAATGWSLASTRARQLAAHGVPSWIAGPTSAGFWDVPIIGARRDSVALNPTLYVDPDAGVRDGLRDGLRVVHTALEPDDVWEGVLQVSGNDVEYRYSLCKPLRTAIDVTRHLCLCEPAAVAALSMAQRRHAALLEGWTPGRSAHGHGSDGARFSDGAPTGYRLTDRLQDQALRESLRDELLGAALRSPRRGLRLVHGALSFVDPRLETPLEAISWCHLCRSGLPLPLLQQWVTGASGRRYRVDFYWPELRLIGEADGAVKYRSAGDVIAEKDRHADLGDAGHALVRWTWQDAWAAQVFLGRIERAMDSAPRR